MALPRPKMAQQSEVWPARAPIPGLTDSAWQEIKRLFHDRCRYCGAPNASDREHRVPLSRDGANRITNIVPACAPCNQAKGSATETEYLSALRALWGRRVPRTPPRLDARLSEIEGRFVPDGHHFPDRGRALLDQVRVPRSRWFEQPARAEFVVHRSREARVAGISYYQDEAAAVLGSSTRWSGMVALVPDPANAFDPNAVGVWHPKGQLGWLPRDAAASVARDVLAAYESGTAVVTGADVFAGKGLIGARIQLSEPFATRPP